jgi:hypothetical protein
LRLGIDAQGFLTKSPGERIISIHRLSETRQRTLWQDHKVEETGVMNTFLKNRILQPCPPSHKWPVSKLKQAKARSLIPQGASASFRFETGD